MPASSQLPRPGADEPIVITGVGAVTPLGVGARTLHERWCAGACGIEHGEAACSDFEPRDFLSAKEARRADRFTQLAIAACVEALADAGWTRDRDDGASGLGAAELPYAPERVGCVLGTGIGGIATLVDGQDTLRERGGEYVSPLSVPLMMSNAGAAALSMRHGLRGPSLAVSSACASGAHALGTALRMLQSGEADAVVAGGSEAGLTPLARAAFSALDALSASGVSRPFDARRDGFVMGEGAAVLVLERAGGAEARDARVLGRLRGYGASSDAHHLTAPRDDGQGQAGAIAAALADAGVRAGEIDYVNAHGTSTPLNDRAETRALKLALGERAREIPVSSTKSAIGHLLGAAGAVEAVATLLALRDRVAPPTLGFAQVEEGLDLDYVPDAARPLAAPAGRPALAISNSFGFGGHNAVLCLETA
ncbi:MAG TPA: beta-ketoacyl-ACP synthase II [Solirubrobacteraceae bacterium]|jgi:3-oxoacyl-[acyl-carrier-protein] synthase II|nr:beta-ketoacyl-ACP synthase II [Solirubrobacteraceae bacterium]